MNEKLKKLKEKVREIDEKVAGGEAVRIKMSKGETKAPPVTITAEGNEPQIKSRAGAMNPPDDAEHDSSPRSLDVDITDEENEAQDFDLDFTNLELSDEDVKEIIETAARKSPTATRTPRTRGMDSDERQTADELPEVNVSYDARSGNWYLHEDCVYTTDDGWTITAKKDFAFDLASVPRFLWAIISSFDLSLIGPLYHDLLYRNGGLLPDDQLSPVLNPTHRFERKDADDILDELMRKAGVSTWKRLAAYRAVRTFAGYAWKD